MKKMTEQIYPCFWFDGLAKAAADYYCTIFNNSNVISSNPLVVMFNLDGKKIMGLNGGPMYKINPSISLFVTCETIERTNKVWNKLIEGGRVYIPIDKHSWSERYGWLQDKFGVTWQISLVNNPGDKPKITPSMLFTGKQFGRAAEAIKLYSSLFENSSTEMMFPYPVGDANEGKVMFSVIKLNNYELIVMDGPGEHDYTFSEGVSFVVNCETQDEIDFYWNKFTGDGEESMCGWLKDKFGVSWQIVPSIIGQLLSDPNKSQNVMTALLKMRKLDIKTLMEA